MKSNTDKLQELVESGALDYPKVGDANTIAMSGQEWYNRFNEQLKRLVSRGDGDTWMGWDCGEVREAAKRASGLNTLKQEKTG